VLLAAVELRSIQEFEQRMSDDALGRFLDPEIEWVPVTESLLAVDSYRGFDGVRRFWGEFLSAWERYRVETPRFDDAGDQVAVVVHIVGRTHELEVDETQSSLLTVRDGGVVRVQSFADPDAARQAAGCRHRRNAGSAASREERQRRFSHRRHLQPWG
jgi:ketosteroid isomerase-like protein